jgi:hypothetical protein
MFSLTVTAMHPPSAICSGSSTAHSDLQLTPWPEFASELYRPSDSRLSTKLVQTFGDRGCHVVSVTDPNGRILGLLDRSFCDVKLERKECIHCRKM